MERVVKIKQNTSGAKLLVLCGPVGHWVGFHPSQFLNVYLKTRTAWKWLYVKTYV